MPKKTIFKNGLRFLEIPLNSTRAVTILILVGVGSSFEKRETNGISHFIEHMFFKGTKKRPDPIKLIEEIDRIGGMRNAFTGKEMTGYWVKVEKSYLEIALDWISDIFLHSKIPEKELEKEKGVILQELNMVLDNPLIYIADLWEETLYGDQPAGWLILGRKENIKRFKRRDLINYINSHYSPKNTVVVAAGNIEKDLSRKIKKYFSEFDNKKSPSKVKTEEKQEKPQVKILRKETDQTHLALGVRAYSVFHPQRFTQKILADLLGGFSSSRIFSEVRQKRGLAYYVGTESEAYSDRGYVVTFAGVSHEDVEKTIKIILREYKRLKEKLVSKKELKKAKDHFQGTLFLSLESSDAIASFYGIQELILGKILKPSDIIKKVEKITSSDIRRVANDIFQPQRLNLSLIGPLKNKDKFEKLLKI